MLPKDLLRYIASFVCENCQIRVLFSDYIYLGNYYNEKRLRSFMRSQGAVIVAFALDNRESFEHCFNWVTRVRICQRWTTHVALVGLRSDLERAVRLDEIEKFAATCPSLIKENSEEILGCPYFEVSVATGQGLQALCDHMVYKVWQDRMRAVDEFEEEQLKMQQQQRRVKNKGIMACRIQ